MDRYIELSQMYLSGPDIPFEIQLAAWDKAGEAPYGITLRDGVDVISFLREFVELRNRKIKYGVEAGVIDPDHKLNVKKQATVIYTKCALEIAESEVKQEKNMRMIFFPSADGAVIGKNGFIALFPDYNDSPVGKFRGDGAAYRADECVSFIGKHFPDIEDEFLKALGL